MEKFFVKSEANSEFVELGFTKNGEQTSGIALNVVGARHLAALLLTYADADDVFLFETELATKEGEG